MLILIVLLVLETILKDFKSFVNLAPVFSTQNVLFHFHARLKQREYAIQPS
jgi:hypothetical protein